MNLTSKEKNFTAPSECWGRGCDGVPVKLLILGRVAIEDLVT